MSIETDITDDGEPARPHVTARPTLILLYVGGAVVPEPSRILLTTGSLVLGRAVADASGVSLNDKRVSRVHAVLQCDSRGQVRVVPARRLHDVGVGIVGEPFEVRHRPIVTA